MPTKPRHLPELLITRRLALRRHTLDLAPMIFTIVDTERERLGEFLPWAHIIKTVEDERTYLKNSRRDWDEARTFDYGIYDGRSNEFLGCIGAHSIRWEHDCCEIGFWLANHFQGHGFIGEALLGIEDELFGSGFHRIEIRCDRRNSRSGKVAERSGYSLEATLRGNLFERGEYRDTMIWGKVYAG